MRKKKIPFLVVLLLIGSLISSTGYAETSIRIKVNGRSKEFSQVPVMVNGRVLVPMRDLFESLGAEVAWNDSTQTVTAKKGSTVFRLQINSKRASKNNQTLELDVSPQLIQGKTMIPIRAVSEALGKEVRWESSSNTVLINDPLAFLNQEQSKKRLDAESAWIASLQQPSGLILDSRNAGTDHQTHANPYFANLAAAALATQPKYRPNVERYINWYLGHVNAVDRYGAKGTIYDYRVGPDGR